MKPLIFLLYVQALKTFQSIPIQLADNAPTFIVLEPTCNQREY